MNSFINFHVRLGLSTIVFWYYMICHTLTRCQEIYGALHHRLGTTNDMEIPKVSWRQSSNIWYFLSLVRYIGLYQSKIYLLTNIIPIRALNDLIDVHICSWKEDKSLESRKSFYFTKLPTKGKIIMKWHSHPLKSLYNRSCHFLFKCYKITVYLSGLWQSI